MSKLFRSLFRLRALPALLLSLPALLLVTVYLWRGYSRLDDFRRQLGVPYAIGPELMQLAVYDTLNSDLRRLVMSPAPANSPLRVFRLAVRRPDWETLERSSSVIEERPYVNAQLTYNNQVQEVQLRLRGNGYWSTALPQKSLKVKLDKGRLLDGHRVFNLLNDPTPMVVGEQLILELARELRVLTPSSDFARVFVNNKDLGVFHYETQPDESLLRQSQRVPGSVFSGDLPWSAKTEELWANAKRWSKVASKNDSEEEAANFSELDRLLKQLRTSSFEEFRHIALTEFDLSAFARVDLLDVAFGGDQHDFRQNHKLYFDPYRGRWEPIAWNFRGFKRDPKLNLVENPLLIRLKQVPEYLELRNRLLHEFLGGVGTPAALRERGLRILKSLAPDLRTDPYWDAYRLLPRVDDFHRRLVRPLNLKRSVMVFNSEFTTYSDRHAQLLAELEANPLYLTQGATSLTQGASDLAQGAASREARPGKRPRQDAESDATGETLIYETELTVTIDGINGVELRAAEATFPVDCASPSWRLHAGTAALSAVVRGRHADLDHKLKLYPNIGLRDREDANARRGKVRTEVLPVNYQLGLSSNCIPEGFQVVGQQLSTAARVVSRAPTATQRQSASRIWPEPREVPTLSAGQLSPHPWSLETPLPLTVLLGPGDVQIPANRIFESHERVVVSPGTRFLMGQGASLVFRGPVSFEGDASEPIEVSGHEGALWGGIVVQGRATAGAMFRHVLVRGGTTPSGFAASYPAMLNFHDTQDVTLQNSRLGHNNGSGDLFRAAYVEGLEVEDSEIVNTTGDGIDLEFSTATLHRVKLIRIGDDALDLMGSTVNVTDTLVLGAKGNGFSAGENSRLTVRNVLVADCKSGVLAKNASEVELSGSLLYRNGVGVHVYTRSVRYEGDSEVGASVLFIVDSIKRAIKREDQKRDSLNQGRVFEYLPRPGGLDSLRTNLVGLAGWDDLGNWLEARRREAVL